MIPRGAVGLMSCTGGASGVVEHLAVNGLGVVPVAGWAKWTGKKQVASIQMETQNRVVQFETKGCSLHYPGTSLK